MDDILKKFFAHFEDEEPVDPEPSEAYFIKQAAEDAFKFTLSGMDGDLVPLIVDGEEVRMPGKGLLGRAIAGAGLAAMITIGANLSLSDEGVLSAAGIPGSVVLQGGNSFGAPMSIGTNDDNPLSFRVNNQQIASLTNMGGFGEFALWYGSEFTKVSPNSVTVGYASNELNLRATDIYGNYLESSNSLTVKSGGALGLESGGGYMSMHGSLKQLYTDLRIISQVPNGTSPFQVASSTMVFNLNADLLDSYHASDLLSRSNHTGTQLAATISDFSSAVLGQALTGFSVGANTAIVAGDNILQAFGKTQGQINALSTGLSGYVPTSRTITAGTGLTGGGDLTINRSFAFDTTWGDARYSQVGHTHDAANIVSGKLNIARIPDNVVYGSNVYGSTTVTSGIDTNSLTKSGFYYLHSNLNRPTNINSHLIHSSYEDTDYAMQIASPYQSAGKLYFRKKDAGVWGASWRAIAEESWVTSQNYLTANQTITLSGDVTGSGATSINTTIANGTVTYAKFQNLAGPGLVGRSGAGSGVSSLITMGSGVSLSGGVLSATGLGGTVTSVGLSLPGMFTVSGSPVESVGTLTATLASQSANTWFGNATGSSAAPSFNALGGLTKTDDTNVTLTLGGSPASALAKAVSLTLGWSGQLAVSRGGTGLGSLGSANQLLRVNGAGNALEYFTPSWTTNTGTVTSVDMTLPTGLQVSGNPIVASGTLAVTFASGYSIPTTTKQGQWDTAYGWNNHAARYVSILETGGVDVAEASSTYWADYNTGTNIRFSTGGWDNAPTAWLPGFLSTATKGTASFQHLFAHGTEDRWHYRRRAGDVWGSWYRIASREWVATATRSNTWVPSASDITTGTLDIARLPTGTSGSQVALGNHTHATLTRGAGLTGSNYNGGSATTWAVDFGTSSGTAAQGNDSRINNGQTAYGWGNHASAGYVTGGPYLPLSGGTLTGELTFQDDGEGITLNGGARVYKRSGGGLVLRRHSADTNPEIENYAGNTRWTIWHQGILGFGTGNNDMARGDHNHDGSYAPLSRNIGTQHSLQGGGDLYSNRTLSLVGDTSSPGNNKLYGTNGSGVRGWYDIPSGSGYVPTSRNVSASTGLGGGGNLGSDISLYVDFGTGYYQAARGDHNHDGSYVPLGRTININGTSYDLSSNRTWNVGTVTGNGTTNYFPMWSSGSGLGNSAIRLDSGEIQVHDEFAMMYTSAAREDFHAHKQLKVGSSGTHGAIGVHNSGSMSIDAAAAIQIDSTTKGLLFSRMSNSDLGAISSPPNGLVVYNTTTHVLVLRSNGSWRSIALI